MNIDNFTNRAEAYAKGRPGYTKEAVEKILLLASDKIPKTENSFSPVFADIGAGTGKLTKEIAERGFFVYAVEPNADMRTQLALTLAPYSNTKIVAGTAEETCLTAQSVDVITVAHALHWFSPDVFRAECRRILKPGGMVAVIYNHVPGRERTDFCRQAVDAFFSSPEIFLSDNPVRLNREQWLAYIASQDDFPLPHEPEYEAQLAALNEKFNCDNIDGYMQCDRITGVYIEFME